MDKTIVKNEVNNIFTMVSYMDEAVAEEDWDELYGLAMDIALAVQVLKEEVESAVL